MEQLQYIQDHTKCLCCLKAFHFQPKADVDTMQHGQGLHCHSAVPSDASRTCGMDMKRTKQSGTTGSHRYQRTANHARGIREAMASFKAKHKARRKNIGTKTNKKIKNKSDSSRNNKSNNRNEPTQPRYPVTSCACNHIICKPCLIQHDAQSASNRDGRSRTSSRFMACPLCHAAKAFSKRLTLDQSLMDGLKDTSMCASEVVIPANSFGSISGVGQLGAHSGHSEIKAASKTRSQSDDAVSADAETNSGTDSGKGSIDSGSFRKGYLTVGNDPMSVPLTAWPNVLNRVNSMFRDEGRGSPLVGAENKTKANNEEATETIATVAPSTMPALSEYSMILRLNMLHDMIRLGVTQNTELYSCAQAH